MKTVEELTKQINEQMETAFNNITTAETPEMVKYWQGVFHNCQFLLVEKEPELDAPRQDGFSEDVK